MALRGLSHGEREEYISRDDPCKTREDGATIFYIKNLGSSVQARLHDMLSAAQTNFNDAGTQTYINRTAQRNRESFRYAVDGWDNFVDDDDNPIFCEKTKIMEGGQTYEVITDDTLNKIRLATINEVGAHAFHRSTLSEQQRKNLEEVSSLLGGFDTIPAKPAKKNKKANGGVSNPRVRAATGATRPKSNMKTTPGKIVAPADQS